MDKETSWYSKSRPVVLLRAYKFSAWEAEARGLLQVLGQPGLLTGLKARINCIATPYLKAHVKPE